MKHHKAKGVWAHRPDEVPLPDSPSTGAKRKKGPLEKASKKHLFDLLHQGRKDLLLEIRFIHLDDGWWRSIFIEGAVKQIEQKCNQLEKLILELERRMG
jgi:hypothetical protein